MIDVDLLKANTDLLALAERDTPLRRVAGSEGCPVIWFAPASCRHYLKTAKQGRWPKENEFITVTGSFTNQPYARRAMGIDWMKREELAQAVPPAYTEYIGHYLIEAIRMRV